MEIGLLKNVGLNLTSYDIWLYQSPKPSSQHPFIPFSLFPYFYKTRKKKLYIENLENSGFKTLFYT
jgi:DNA modification methylase